MPLPTWPSASLLAWSSLRCLLSCCLFLGSPPSSSLSEHLPQLALSPRVLSGRGLALCLFPAWEGEAGLERTVQKCRKTLPLPAQINGLSSICLPRFFPCPWRKCFISTSPGFTFLGVGVLGLPPFHILPSSEVALRF